ncbi:DUF559 domain-containing protein [Nocardioides pacificus]
MSVGAEALEWEDEILALDPVDALIRLGGVATRQRLLRLTTIRRVRTAVGRGDIKRLTRNRYGLPDIDRALQKAGELHGVVSHLSAAQHHEWGLAFRPSMPWVTVPRNAARKSRRGVHLHYADLDGETGLVTSKLRTVVDCARTLPFAPALAVADSALRSGDVDPHSLVRAAEQVRGKGAGAARRVASAADARAANAFESVLRALAIEAGLSVVPQHPVSAGGRMLHPDLVDAGRRLVLEADSWEFHTGKEAHERDCWRYNALVLEGWTVLRFTWQQVMLDPDYVLACLRAVTGR